MAKQTIKQRKAIRSAAARKGWETRIARRLRAMRERDAANERAFAMAEEALRRERAQTQAWADVSGIPDILRGAPPKPSLWQRIKRWFA